MCEHVLLDMKIYYKVILYKNVWYLYRDDELKNGTKQRIQKQNLSYLETCFIRDDTEHQGGKEKPFSG